LADINVYSLVVPVNLDGDRALWRIELSLDDSNGVATISRRLIIIGLFCRISSLSYGSFAKKTHNFKERTNRSHPSVGA